MLPKFRSNLTIEYFVGIACYALALASFLVFVPTFRDYSDLTTRLARSQAASKDAALFGTIGAFVFLTSTMIFLIFVKPKLPASNLPKKWFLFACVPLILNVPLGWLAIGLVVWLAVKRKL